MTNVCIVGVGSPFGDDRIGIEAVETLRESGLLATFPGASITTACCDRPGSRLIALLAGIDVAIVIDAMQSGAPPGSLRRWTDATIEANLPLLSSHGLGVAEALALGRALGALPPRIVVFGVEIGAGPEAIKGSEPSAAVRSALPALLDRIAGELATV